MVCSTQKHFTRMNTETDKDLNPTGLETPLIDDSYKKMTADEEIKADKFCGYIYDIDVSDHSNISIKSKMDLDLSKEL